MKMKSTTSIRFYNKTRPIIYINSNLVFMISSCQVMDYKLFKYIGSLVWIMIFCGMFWTIATLRPKYIGNLIEHIVKDHVFN